MSLQRLLTHLEDGFSPSFVRILRFPIFSSPFTINISISSFQLGFERRRQEKSIITRCFHLSSDVYMPYDLKFWSARELSLQIRRPCKISHHHQTFSILQCSRMSSKSCLHR